MNEIPLGPRCTSCRQLEAHCARAAGCCWACTHTFGESRTSHPTPVCGSDGGYRKHLRDATVVCRDCRLAHNRAHIRWQQVAS